MKKYILGTLLAMVVYIAVSYLDRGYWAFGLEIFFPLVGAILYKANKEKRASC